MRLVGNISTSEAEVITGYGNARASQRRTEFKRYMDRHETWNRVWDTVNVEALVNAEFYPKPQSFWRKVCAFLRFDL